MIYIDASVALAHILVEDRHPPDRLWDEVLVSSRLLEFEVWTRIHARALARSHGDHVQAMLGRIAFFEMVTEVLGRGLDAFPLPVRTLDGLHLATMQFIRAQGQPVRLASYDARMSAAAVALGFPLEPL